MRTMMGFGLVLALASSVMAAVPTYTSKTGSGSTSASVLFTPTENQQIRLVTLIGSSDKAGSAFSLYSATGAYVISKSNTIGTTITVSRTNGLAAGNTLLIHKATGETDVVTISAFPAATNITLSASNTVITLPGDEVYLMSSATQLGCGETTNKAYTGEAIYVGNPGRPVRVVLDGTTYSSLDSVVARYE